MPDVIVASYGAWKSPISADMLAKSGVSSGWLETHGEDVYWVEGRPSEGGRYVVVRRTPDGVVSDITPEDYNARTLVHEYGGGMYWLHNRSVYFTNVRAL